MARKTRVILTDDIDGSEASTTIEFSLDGISYEIDLNDDHAAQLREALEPWTAAGRRPRGRARRGTARTPSPSQNAAMRQWARDHGYEVSDRGRISAEIQQAYAAAS